MLPIRGEKTYKEGAVATLTVYDRRGRRLGTIYLGQMPEAYQTTLSEELTRLLTELLKEWEGASPRLVYLTDAGYHPSEYFDNVLTSMEHPRHPGRLLEWTRIVDFYHASEYLAKLAQVLLFLEVDRLVRSELARDGEPLVDPIHGENSRGSGNPRAGGGTQPPKSSKAMFSDSTPKSSSILSTACSISGGPQM
jgi:hypothetical protein